MPRPRVHSDDAILDAARDLVVEGGPAAATTVAISARSGAPSGSIYHRFGSRRALLAEVWLRTVRTFQAGLIAATGDAVPGVERAVAASRWVIEFAAAQPQDARLLARGTRDTLLDGAPPPEFRAALDEVNAPGADLLRRIAIEVFGAAGPEQLETVTVAVVDVPHAVVQRHLAAGDSPIGLLPVVERATRALLSSVETPRSSPV